MEATILSPDSPNAMFNPVAAGGNTQVKHGSVLPFSTILQSQQQPALVASAMLAQNGGKPVNQMLTDGSDARMFEPHSLSADAETAAASWLLVDAQKQSLVSAESIEDEELPLVAIASDSQIVPVQSDQLIAAEPLSKHIERTTVGELSQGDSSQSQSQTKDLTQGLDVDRLLAERSVLHLRGAGGAGGGGVSAANSVAENVASAMQGPQTFAGTGAPKSSIDSELVSAQQPLATGASESSKPTVLSIAAQREAQSNRVTNSGVQTADQRHLVHAQNAVQTTAVVDQSNYVELAPYSPSTNTALSTHPHKSSELIASTVPQSLAADSSAAAHGESGLELAALDTAEEAAQTTVSQTKAPILGGESSSAVKASLDGTPTVRAREQSSEHANLNAEPLVKSSGAVALENADVLANHSELQRATSHSIGISAAVVDPLSSQQRSVVPPQTKGRTSAEGMNGSTALGASEGYHWLSDSAEFKPEDEPLMMQTDVSIDLDGVALTTANNTLANSNNNARIETALAEPITALKRTADAAPTDTLLDSTEQTTGASLDIDTPVQDAQWSQALAYRLQFMAQQGIHRAQVQLNPAELGPLEITVDVVDDVAKVLIAAEHAATREAVEQAVPRLREMMALSGFGETAVDLHSSDDKPSSFSASLQPFNQSNTGSDRERSGRDGESGAKTQASKGIETLASDEIAQRTAEGRLSFYV